MNDDEFAALKADIQQNGQRRNATVVGNLLLDGRNRARACKELNIKLNTVPYSGSDPLGFVLSVNLNRRHLTPSQRAFLAVELKEKARCPNNPLLKNVEISTKLSDEALAKMAGVDRGTVADAKVVAKNADEETKRAVKDGKRTVSKVASEIRNKPRKTDYEKILQWIDRLNDVEKAEIGKAYCPKCN